MWEKPTLTNNGAEDMMPDGLRGATLGPSFSSSSFSVESQTWKWGDKTGPLLPNRESQVAENKPQAEARRAHQKTAPSGWQLVVCMLGHGISFLSCTVAGGSKAECGTSSLSSGSCGDV